MSQTPSYWTTNPEWIILIDFLVEKTKNVKTPISVAQISKEFKNERGSEQSLTCVKQRIERLRAKIHQFHQLDTDARVRIMFALSISVDVDFINELEKQAEVTVDEYRRIIEYKKDDFVLKGAHPAKVFHKELAERDDRMLMFLAEHSMVSTTPVSIRTLTKQFKEATGATENCCHLDVRFRAVRDTIYESTVFDKETKVRMMFVSGAKIPNYVLSKLQKDAIVEVDELNRITKYNNGESLYLEGSQCSIAKMKESWADKKKIKCELSPKSGKKSQKRMSDYYLPQVNIKKSIFQPSTPPCLSKKSTTSSEDTESDNSLIKYFNELMNGCAPIENSKSSSAGSTPTQRLLVPKLEEQWMAEMPVLEREVYPDASTVPPESNTVTQKKILEVIRTLILTLDIPTLSTEFQQEIENKMAKIASIPTSVFLMAMECFVEIVTKSAETQLEIESISLRDVLWTLRTSIITVHGFEEFQKELKKKIEELTVEDKVTPGHLETDTFRNRTEGGRLGLNLWFNRADLHTSGFPLCKTGTFQNRGISQPEISEPESPDRSTHLCDSNHTQHRLCSSLTKIFQKLIN